MNTFLRRLAYLSVPALAMACLGADSAPLPAPPPPAVGHVFVIVLENESFNNTFGPGSKAPYLSDSLVRAGALLRRYYGTGHFSLDNYIAMVSGIAPSAATQLDCGRYADFVRTGTASDGQPIGAGCVYPADVPTLANQLRTAGRAWRGYFEDMGNTPAREPATCGHVPIGQTDPTAHATSGDQYAAKHNPFVYFHAVIDSAFCGEGVVPLTALESDLKGNTPSFSFIVPNLCHDGHDNPCVDGEPGGLASADAFLRLWVPRILEAPAFRDGLLIITFDEGSSSDASACCDEPSGPNVSHPGYTGAGGGLTGAVVISPFVRPGTKSDVPYNHYSLLKSIEEIFRLPYLGYAARPGLSSFGDDVYTKR